MKEAEMIDYFLQAQDPDYLHYMLAAIGKPFAEAIKIGEIVENGMKSGKMVSQAALKATTQAIQSGSGSFGNRKKKDEGSMMASGFGEVQRGIVPSYVQFQQGQSDSPQHYYPPQGPRYSVPSQQYIVFNAQAYARPPNHQQWRAPIPQGARPNFQAPYNPRPRQEYVREQDPKKEFTPIGESYTSLFRKLMQLKLIEPIMPRYVNPNSKGFDSNARCEYHSNTQGHSTENCWTLKKAIENLIEAKAIVVTNNEDTPNITNNPLPAHDNTHFIGMIGDDRDYKQSRKTEMIVGTIGPEPKVIVRPPQLAPLIVKGASSSSNLAGSEKMVLYVPGSTKKIEVQLGGPRLYIPGGIQKIVPNNALRNITEPVVIRPVAQLPVSNPKAIPWNYNKTVMTYKGNEIVEEIDEMAGWTRSGRRYSPEELRKVKQAKENHFPVKEAVSEKETKDFLKKVKMQDYSFIDQLRKTPAQISLLSLLLHSEEHRRVLIKTLNEAYVPEKTTVNQLEKMAERFFEVNKISFSDDDLPEEGAGHNKALHLMVKCEGHYVKGVMIDGGSSVDVCPLSILQQLNIDSNRIRTSRGSIWPELYHPPYIKMVKFEFDGQEIVVHGEDESFIYNDPSIPCIEAKEGCESLIYQTFEVIEVDQVEEGKPILQPHLSATSMMVASLMLRNGYEPGKGSGSFLQGIVNPIAPFLKKDTFGLGFKPTSADINRAKARQKNDWKLSKPIPHIAYSFVKPQFKEVQNPSTHDDIDEVCQGLKDMFYGINMVQVGEGPSRASVQLIAGIEDTEWVKSRLEQLSMIDEKRLAAEEAKGKFAPNWQGPYLVKKILSKGALHLTDIEGKVTNISVNADAVKRYYV
uniref:G-patch domain-containing protein n=1 Tax=Nicotiana tabacum TaxID=4097 RepID=A0A1S4D8T3_TOBAC|nr:PREDICTED: uncharacterized protein LOC107827208 [Nicotiana tabacum]